MIQYIFALLAVAVFCVPAYAEIPIGTDSQLFEPPPGLWDISGRYQDAGGNLVLAQDIRGNITGRGTLRSSEGGIVINLSIHSILGTIRTVLGTPHINLKLTFTGTARNGRRTVNVNGNARYSLDLSGDVFVGTSVVRVCAMGRCVTQSGPSELEPKTDGTWTVVLNLKNPSGSALAGKGAILVHKCSPEIAGCEGLTPKRKIPLNFKGTYDSSTDLARIKGTNTVAGQWVVLDITGATGEIIIHELTAKLLGQNIHYLAP